MTPPTRKPRKPRPKPSPKPPGAPAGFSWTQAIALGLTPEVALALLGETICDVYLNDVAFWRNIPRKVWEHTIGGYQVIKKWLSYRECSLLGRDLKPEEARYVTEMVRRIAAIILLQPALDHNYEAIKADPFAWDALTGKG